MGQESKGLIKIRGAMEITVTRSISAKAKTVEGLTSRYHIVEIEGPNGPVVVINKIFLSRIDLTSFPFARLVRKFGDLYLYHERMGFKKASFLSIAAEVVNPSV